MNRRGPAAEVVLRLYDDAWQAWKLAPDGGAAQRLGGIGDPLVTEARRIIAVPARRVIASALWIEGNDESLVVEAARLELDLRGLLPRGQGADGITLRLRPEEARTLVVAAAFPGEWPEEPAIDGTERFEASPFLLPLPADSVTLWREEGDIVAAFRRGNDVVYWETIDRDAGADEMRTWIGLMALRLQGEGILSGPLKVISWVEGLAAARVAPSGWTASSEAVIEPLPVLERAKFEWRPPQAVQASAARAQRERVRTLVLAVAAAYVALIVVFGAYFGYLKFQASRLLAESKALNAEVATFESIAREWSMIAPTAETDTYPLEILRNVVAALPASGIRLTKFSIEGEQIWIEGEADNYPLAASFYEAVEKSEELANITWDNALPTLKQTGVASFRMKGQILPEIGALAAEGTTP